MKSCFFIVLMVLLVGCGGTKKVTSTDTKDKTQTEISLRDSLRKDSVKVSEIETRKLIDSLIVFEEIKTVYEPIILEEGQKVESVIKEKHESRQTNSSKEEDVEVKRDNTSKTEERGSEVDFDQDKDIDKKEDSKETPKDPFVTRYRFYILLLLVLTALFFYLKKKFKIL